MNLQGAIDLGALAKAREVQQQRAQNPKVDYVLDVVTANFEVDVLQRSLTVPVVVQLWSPRSAKCNALTPVLEKVALEFQGKFILARVNVDTDPQIAQAFQAQTVPMVFAFVASQPLGLFQDVITDVQFRAVVNQVLEAANAAGLVAETSEENDTPREPEDPSDPRFDAAEAALELGDWDTAISEYKNILKATPNDAIAKIAVLNVELMKRTDGMDFDVVLASTQTDLDTQLAMADALFILNDYETAFAQLINLIRETGGEERNLVRERLLNFFEIVGPADPAVVKGRVALSNALY